MLWRANFSYDKIPVAFDFNKMTIIAPCIYFMPKMIDFFLFIFGPEYTCLILLMSSHKVVILYRAYFQPLFIWCHTLVIRLYLPVGGNHPKYHLYINFYILYVPVGFALLCSNLQSSFDVRIVSRGFSQFLHTTHSPTEWFFLLFFRFKYCMIKTCEHMFHAFDCKWVWICLHLHQKHKIEKQPQQTL